MALHDTERRVSGWRCSKTALNEDDAINLLKEFAELKRKQRKNDPEVKRMKSKYKLKASAYPSPGNIFHTGRQLQRSPGPGVLPLLPSQKFEQPILVDDSFKQLGPLYADGLNNMVPCGRQLPRTPLKSKSEHCSELREIQTNIQEHGLISSSHKPQWTVGSPTIWKLSENKRNTTAERISDTLQCLENENPAAEVSADKKTVAEEATCSAYQTCSNRRISELPVQGLNQMRISGILRKMGDYECRSEDLEFLQHMENQEKVKVLKAEFVRLKKDLTTTKHERELIICRKQKIEADILKMKFSCERVVQLGRAFLTRTQDAACAQSFTPEDVLKQLNQLTIQTIHQQERTRLLAAQKDVDGRRQEAARAHLEDSQSKLVFKMKSLEKRIGVAKERDEVLKNDVIALKAEIEKMDKERSELQQSLQKTREQMSWYIEQQSTPALQTIVSEEDRERMNRRLQRILYRKNLYLEREKIIRRLRHELK